MNTELSSMKRNTQDHNINALRLLFTIGIVYLHIFSNIPHNDHPYYVGLYTLCKKSSLFIEFFLIVGGYYLWSSIQKSKDEPLIVTILGKFIRLWPVLASSIILAIVMHKTTWYDAIFDLLFLRSTGISLNNAGIIWYIGPYFWCTILLMVLFRYFNNQRMLVVLAGLCYLSFAVNLNIYNGGIGRGIIYTFVSLSMIRVFGGLSLGILLAVFMEAFHRAFPPKNSGSIGMCLLCTFLELSTLTIILGATIFGFNIGKNNALVVILFLILIVSFLENKGLLSRLLNHNIFSILSKPCYAIYIMQQSAFYLLDLSFFQNTYYIENHPLRTIFITIVFTIFIGSITYLIVEKPALTLWKRYKATHQ